MKPKLLLPLFLIVMLGFMNQASQAAIILNVGNAIFMTGSGVQPLDIFVRSDAANTSLFLTADFQLSAGVFPTTAGVYGQAGMVGFGNIQDPPGSQFVSAGNNTATLSLDFTNAQLFPDTNGLLARMFIDTTGLAIGNYNVEVTTFTTQVTSSSVNGSFSISAVPEPGSLCLLGFASLIVIRRRQVTKMLLFGRI